MGESPTGSNPVPSAMKRAEKVKVIEDILQELLLKIVQLEDPYITKLRSSHRDKIVQEFARKVVRVV